MSVNGTCSSQHGNNDDIGNKHDINENKFRIMGPFLLPQNVGNAVFDMTKTMLYLLQ